MTPDIDLDALTALEQAASPAPWAHEYEGSYIVHGDGHTIAEAGYRAADAAFIAAVRNNLPALLSALTATRAELGTMTERRNVAVENAQQYRKNWDSAVAANMTALETIGTLKDQRDRVMTLCATTPDVELDTLPQRIREVYEDAAEPQPDEPTAGTVTATFSKPAVCGHGCTTWCTTGTACPLDDEAAGAGDGEQDTDRLTAALDGSMVSPNVRQAITSLMGDDVQVSVPLRQKLLTAAERALRNRREANRAGDGEQDTATTYALDVTCPECGAAPGQSCRVMPDGEQVRWPHRVRDAASVQGAADGEAQA